MAAPQPGIEDVVVDPVPFGQYLLLDILGEGRTGPVYRACLRREGKSDKLLAIKRVAEGRGHDPEFNERFVHVMNRAIQLEHPAHCSIEDCDRAEDGTPYVVMALVAGMDLWRVGTELAERGEVLAPQLLGYIGSQIAAALSAAHRMARAGKPAPLFHGELSPRDILIGYDGRVLLTGLGSALLHAGAPPDPERERYLSPERHLGAAPSATADVYSLGACLYEMLGGHGADEARANAANRAESRIRAAVPRPLEEIVHRAIAEAPDARWDGAAELSAALHRWSGSQAARGDARALATFMQAQFGAARAADERLAQRMLARIPASAPRLPQAVPAAATPTPRPLTYPQLVRANERSSARPVVQGAPRVERVELKQPNASRPPIPAPAAAAPSSPEPAPAAPPAKPAAANPWGDPTERTPPRGVLMRQLASEMAKEPESEPSAAPGQTGPLAHFAGDAFADEDNWDDVTPANRWISTTEEKASNEKPRASAVRLVAPPLTAPPPLPRPQPLSRLPQPVAAALPLPAAHPQRAPEPAPAARKRTLLIAGAAAVVVAAIAIASFRHATAEHSVLQVATHPAGAEVFVRGERLGATPLERDDLTAGAATLELRAPGFESVTRTIRLAKGAPVSLDVDLVRHVVKAAAPLAANPAPEAVEDDSAEEPADGRQPDLDQRRSSRRRRSADDQGSEARTTDVAFADAPFEPSSAADDEPPVPEAAAAPDALAGLRVTPAPIAAEAPVAAAPTAPAQPAAAEKQPAAPAPRAPAPAPRGISRAAVEIDRVAPRFPARAKRLDVTNGVVSIEYTVARDGSVKSPTVVQSEPEGLFDEAALDAIKRFKYQPKLENGQPVESRLRFKFRFGESDPY